MSFSYSYQGLGCPGESGVAVRGARVSIATSNSG